MLYDTNMATKKASVQIQVTVTATAETYDFIEKNARDGNISATLAGYCNYFLDRQARGGIFLEPEDHDYIAALNEGKRFPDSRTLVHFVEKGLKRDDGQFSFTVKVDPAHVPVLIERARDGNLTPEELVDGVLQMIFASGMIYDFTPTLGRSIPFTANMLAATAELCERKKIDSSDIAGLIAEDRFIPVPREVKAQMLALSPEKVDFDARDLARYLKELVRLRAEVKELKSALREVDSQVA